jgi:WD40 repeat protein
MRKLYFAFTTVALILTFMRTMTAFAQTSSQRVEVIDWSINGDMAVGYSDENRIEILNSSEQLIAQLEIEDFFPLKDLSWNLEGSRLAYTDGEYVAIWDKSDEEILFLDVPDTSIRSIAWSPNGDQIATISQSGIGPAGHNFLSVWNTETGELISVVYTEQSENYFPSVSWNPVDINQIAIGDISGRVIIRNVEMREQIEQLNVEVAPDYDPNNDSPEVHITSLAWNSEGNQLAIGTDDGQINVWDTTTWQTTTYFPDGIIINMDWSDDGILAIANGMTLQLIDVQHGLMLSIYESEFLLRQSLGVPMEIE